jgi:hypothetical protein
MLCTLKLIISATNIFESATLATVSLAQHTISKTFCSVIFFLE